MMNSSVEPCAHQQPILKLISVQRVPSYWLACSCYLFVAKYLPESCLTFESTFRAHFNSPRRTVDGRTKLPTQRRLCIHLPPTCWCYFRCHLNKKRKRSAYPHPPKSTLHHSRINMFVKPRHSIYRYV